MADMEELKRKSAEAKARKWPRRPAVLRREAPAAARGRARGAEAAASYAEADKTGKIPGSPARPQRSGQGCEGQCCCIGGAPAEGGGVAVLDKPTAGAIAAGAALAGGPANAGLVGPAGHTQRLLTVVKAGSIQDVKATPTDKVSTWPHLLVGEFVASLACLTVLMVLSIYINAPLLALANYNQTPNPSKAPWYFLGLQELLTMFHPMVAGVTIPGMGLFLLILAPYIDKNPSNKPEDRKFAISLFAVFMMFWAVLVIIGSFFRGPGFNFIYPWQKGIFFEL